MYAMPLCSDTVFDFYSVDEWDAIQGFQGFQGFIELLAPGG